MPVTVNVDIAARSGRLSAVSASSCSSVSSSSIFLSYRAMWSPALTVGRRRLTSKRPRQQPMTGRFRSRAASESTRASRRARPACAAPRRRGRPGQRAESWSLPSRSSPRATATWPACRRIRRRLDPASPCCSAGRWSGACLRRLERHALSLQGARRVAVRAEDPEEDVLAPRRDTRRDGTLARQSHGRARVVGGGESPRTRPWRFGCQVAVAPVSSLPRDAQGARDVAERPPRRERAFDVAQTNSSSSGRSSANARRADSASSARAASSASAQIRSPRSSIHRASTRSPLGAVAHRGRLRRVEAGQTARMANWTDRELRFTLVVSNPGEVTTAPRRRGRTTTTSLPRAMHLAPETAWPALPPRSHRCSGERSSHRASSVRSRRPETDAATPHEHRRRPREIAERVGSSTALGRRGERRGGD